MNDKEILGATTAQAREMQRYAYTHQSSSSRYIYQAAQDLHHCCEQFLEKAHNYHGRRILVSFFDPDQITNFCMEWKKKMDGKYRILYERTYLYNT